MKNILIAAVIITLLSSSAFAHWQQWGQISPRSRIILNHVFTWHNTFDEPHNLVTVRRSFFYPMRFYPNNWNELDKIGAITIDHHGCGETATAELMMGGPKSRFAQLDFENTPGGCIEATINIWSR